MNSVLLIGGFLVIAVTISDFLYTTLSCNGSGFISTALNRLLSRILVPRYQWLRDWSGVVHLTSSVLSWIVLFLVGGMMVYSANPDMVVQSTTKNVANFSQRVYYTVFNFSTLGLGDYVPNTTLSRYFTSFYALLGFGVLTTAITYILSVTGAATAKKNLATFISSMGETPSDLFAYFTTKSDGSFFTERMDDLIVQLNMHINNHLCYPIVHYFHSDQRAWSAVIQLASLHECMLALHIHYSDQKEVLTQLRRLDRSLGRFLEVSAVPDYRRRPDDNTLPHLRKMWRKEVIGSKFKDDQMSADSRAFGALPRQAGHNWDTVFN